MCTHTLTCDLCYVSRIVDSNAIIKYHNISIRSNVIHSTWRFFQNDICLHPETPNKQNKITTTTTTTLPKDLQNKKEHAQHKTEWLFCHTGLKKITPVHYSSTL